MADWEQQYFERGYAQRWGLPGISDQVRLEVAGLGNHLDLSPGSLVVDVGCGHSRHAVVMAQRGAKVVGVDSAAALLIEAQHLSAQTGVQPQLVRGDMRRLPFRAGQFHAATLMDAFGFFEAERENELALEEISRVLAPGGRLCLKVVNGAPILADFRARDHEERDGSVMTIVRTLTLDPPRMIERIHITGARGNGEYERRQRLYRSDDMYAMLDRAGFSILAVSASANGLQFEAASSATMWLFCERMRCPVGTG